MDVALLMLEIEVITRKNIDIRRLTNDLMELLKESVVFSFTQDEKLITKLTVEEAKELSVIPSNTALSMIEDLMETAEKYRSASNLLSYFEIGMLKLLSRIGEPKHQVVKQGIKAVEAKEVVQKQVINKEPEVQIEVKPEEKVIEVDVKDVVEPLAPVEELMFESVDVQDLKPKPKKKVKALLKTENLDRNMILRLLNSGDKQKRLEINSKWDKIRTYLSDLKYGRVAQLLVNALPVALNEGFMVLSHSDKMVVNELNSEDNQDLIEEFTNQLFGQSMRAYAIDTQSVNEITVEFKKLFMENNLPEPIVFEKKKKKVVEQEVNIEKGLFDLFGEENVEII